MRRTIITSTRKVTRIPFGNLPEGAWFRFEDYDKKWSKKGDLAVTAYNHFGMGGCADGVELEEKEIDATTIIRPVKASLYVVGKIAISIDRYVIGDCIPSDSDSDECYIVGTYKIGGMKGDECRLDPPNWWE